MPLNKIFEIKIKATFDEFRSFLTKPTPIYDYNNKLFIDDFMQDEIYEISLHEILPRQASPPSHTISFTQVTRPQYGELKYGGLIRFEKFSEEVLIVEGFSNQWATRDLLYDILDRIDNAFGIIIEDESKQENLYLDETRSLFGSPVDSGSEEDQDSEIDLELEPEEKILKDMWNSGSTWKEIAVQLGYTEETIGNKLTVLRKELRNKYGRDLIFYKNDPRRKKNNPENNVGQTLK